MIKLDAMENPYGLSGEARAEIAAAVANARINRYPDGGGDEVKAALRQSLALPDDVGLVLGNGSDELLQMLTDGGGQARRRRAGARSVVRAVPHARRARQPALRRRAAARGPDARHRRDARGDRARASPRSCGSRCPNNPTGTLFRRRRRRADHRARRRASSRSTRRTTRLPTRSFLPRVLEFPNLLVVRTLSKVGMAGVRLGYAAAHPGVDRRARQGAPAVQHQRR